MPTYSRYVLTVFTASTIAVGAWLKFSIGPVPYTFQNFGVVLASLVLNPLEATASVLLYISMVALGLPVGAGLTGGPHLLFGYTAGYIWGFLLSAPLVSVLARVYLNLGKKCPSKLNKRDIVALTVLATIGMLPTYLLGYLTFRYYALSSSSLLNWAKAASGVLGLHGSSEFVLLASAVLLFLPQDMLLDHFLAVLSFKKVCELLRSRGVVADESCSCEQPVR